MCKMQTSSELIWSNSLLLTSVISVISFVWRTKLCVSHSVVAIRCWILVFFCWIRSATILLPSITNCLWRSLYFFILRDLIYFMRFRPSTKVTSLIIYISKLDALFEDKYRDARAILCPYDEIQIERHIKKEVACEKCHGEVKQMDRLKDHRFKMGFCVECHRENKANLDCWLACHS